MDVKRNGSVLLREQTIGETKRKMATEAIHARALSERASVLLFSSACVFVFKCVCLCFNLYLVFAIIAFSCNWHIVSEWVSVCVCLFLSSVYDATRARTIVDLLITRASAQWAGEQAWQRGRARERASGREWDFSQSVCGYLDGACDRALADVIILSLRRSLSLAVTRAALESR